MCNTKFLHVMLNLAAESWASYATSSPTPSGARCASSPASSRSDATRPSLSNTQTRQRHPMAPRRPTMERRRPPTGRRSRPTDRLTVHSSLPAALSYRQAGPSCLWHCLLSRQEAWPLPQRRHPQQIGLLRSPTLGPGIQRLQIRIQ
jgi:hypothetical protein